MGEYCKPYTTITITNIEVLKTILIISHVIGFKIYKKKQKTDFIR